MFLVYDSAISQLVRENVLTKDVTLNQKEQAGLSVLNSVPEYQVPVAQAAELLGVIQLHARRMLASYRERGAAALPKGLRQAGLLADCWHLRHITDVLPVGPAGPWVNRPGRRQTCVAAKGAAVFADDGTRTAQAIRSHRLYMLIAAGRR